MNEDYVKFDENKFRVVVHFVCSKCDPDKLGNVKLHKILYFADMLHFSATGSPLTGADYVKQKFGPTARHLTKALSWLRDSGFLRIETSDYFGFEKKAYHSLRQPKPGVLSNSEVSLIEDVIDFVCAKSAREISDLSHDLAWEVSSMGERIPYAAVMGWHATEITPRDIEVAIAEAKRIRPIIEATRCAS